MCSPHKILRRPEKTGSTSACRSAFEVLDGDGDGKISREDLRRFFHTAFNDDDDEMIGTMICLADSNNDGLVEYEEFERVLGLSSSKSKQTASCWGFDVMGDVFKLMDKDEDGRLSYGDLKNFMTWAGISVSEEDINGMIRLGGGGGENGVSFDGLLKILDVGFVGL